MTIHRNVVSNYICWSAGEGGKGEKRYGNNGVWGYGGKNGDQ